MRCTSCFSSQCNNRNDICIGMKHKLFPHLKLLSLLCKGFSDCMKRRTETFIIFRHPGSTIAVLTSVYHTYGLNMENEHSLM